MARMASVSRPEWGGVLLVVSAIPGQTVSSVETMVVKILKENKNLGIFKSIEGIVGWMEVRRSLELNFNKT